MFDTLTGHDLAVRLRAGRNEPWNQFSAAVVGGTEGAISYFRLVAAYIMHYYRRNELWWGIDQLAMYCAYEYMNDSGKAPRIAAINDRVMDQNYLPDSVLWFTAGAKKQTRPTAETATSQQQTRESRYWQLYERYSM